MVERPMCTRARWVAAEGDYRACTRRGAHEHEGKPYCAQHHPGKVAAKRAEAFARWNAENEARQRRFQVEAAAPELLHAWEEFFAGKAERDLAGDDDEADMVGLARQIRAVERARTAIAKARGGTP